MYSNKQGDLLVYYLISVQEYLFIYVTSICHKGKKTVLLDNAATVIVIYLYQA